jgi:hypothetical protein
VIKLRIFRWDQYSGLPRCAQSHQDYKSKAGRKKKTKDRHEMTKTEVGVKISKDERSTESQEMQVTID